MNSEKSALRAEFKIRAQIFFAEVTESALEEIHAAIAEKVNRYCANLFSDGAIPPQRIAIYEPMRVELPVRRIVEQVNYLKGKEFLYPEYDKTDMWFVSDVKRERAIPDFIIVPGLFVDSQGNRLGRGKGYYDRFLKNSPLEKAKHVFLGYPFQFIDFVPTDNNDVPVTPLM